MAGPEAPPRPALAGLRRLALRARALLVGGGLFSFVVLSTATPTLASPWLVSHQEIAWIGFSEGETSRIVETGAMKEQGLGKGRLALISEVWRQGGGDGVAHRSALALKVKAHHGPRWAVSAQAGPLYGADAGGGCAGAGGEVRAGVGRSFGTGLGRGVERSLGRIAGQARRLRSGAVFGALELAYRAQGGCAHALREATIGYEPEHKWLLLGQAFEDRDLHGTETVKVQISAVRFRRARGVQVGVRVRVDGADPEPAVIIGVWRRERRPGH